MRSLADLARDVLAGLQPILPGLAPAFEGATPRPRRFWGDSTPHPVPFKPVPKSDAWRTYRKLHDFDRRTRAADRQNGGAIGHAGLRVAHALLFDFRNYKTGRLDPSYAAIAEKANVCIRTVGNVLHRLRDLGVVAWERRRAVVWRDGRMVIEQETNAYTVQPDSNWRGYIARPEPEAPTPDTCGAPAPVPSVLEAAALETDSRSKLAALETAPAGGLEAVLARLGRAIEAKEAELAPIAHADTAREASEVMPPEAVTKVPKL